MNIRKYLSTEQVEYIKEMGTCNLELDKSVTIRDVVLHSRCGNSVSAGKLINTICCGQLGNNVGTFLYRVACEYPDNKRLGTGGVNGQIVEKVLWVLKRLDGEKLVSARLIMMMHGVNDEIKRRVNAVLFDDKKLGYGGECAIQVYNALASIVANTHLCDYILAGKLPYDSDDKASGLGVTNDLLITYDLSVKTLKLFDSLGIYSRTELLELSERYNNQWDFSKRLQAATGKPEKYLYGVIDELMRVGVLQADFEMDTSNDLEDASDTKSSNNGDNEVKLSGKKPKGKFSKADKEKSIDNTFKFLDKLIDNVSELDTEKVLYPDGFKEMCLCSDIKDYEAVADKLMEDIEHEVTNGWKLWKVNEPEVYGAMIRVKYVMRKFW